MNNMENSIFSDDLMDDNGGTGMIDPFDPTEVYYSPEEDFDQFQNNSPATRDGVNDSGYRLPGEDLMSDPISTTVKNNVENEDLVYQILKEKGYNPNSIKVEGEDGTIEEYDFNDLSREDQISLLQPDNDEEEYDERMSEVIDFFSNNELSLKDLVNTIEERVKANYVPEQTQNYTVDDFNDEELFLVDFKNRYGDEFTDQELFDELNNAKENEELFNRRMVRLRESYKEMEKQAIEAERNQEIAAQEEERTKYINNMYNISRSISEMHDTVTLDDNDRNETLSFMFDTDALGNTKLNQALSDPETLYKVAWYIQHGDDVLKQVHSYYQKEISRLSGAKPQRTANSVVKEGKQTQHTAKRQIRRIEDLFE